MMSMLRIAPLQQRENAVEPLVAVDDDFQSMARDVGGQSVGIAGGAGGVSHCPLIGGAP